MGLGLQAHTRRVLGTGLNPLCCCPCRATGIEELLTATQLGGDQKKVLDSVKEYYGEVRGQRRREWWRAGGAAGGRPLQCTAPRPAMIHARPSIMDAPLAQVLTSSGDLRTSACTAAASVPPAVRDILKKVPKEVVKKFYGCGSPCPMGIDGLRCGGRDQQAEAEAEAASLGGFERSKPT